MSEHEHDIEHDLYDPVARAADLFAPTPEEAEYPTFTRDGVDQEIEAAADAWVEAHGSWNLPSREEYRGHPIWDTDLYPTRDGNDRTSEQPVGFGTQWNWHRAHVTTPAEEYTGHGRTKTVLASPEKDDEGYDPDSPDGRHAVRFGYSYGVRYTPTYKSEAALAETIALIRAREDITPWRREEYVTDALSAPRPKHAWGTSEEGRRRGLAPMGNGNWRSLDIEKIIAMELLFEGGAQHGFHVTERTGGQPGRPRRRVGRDYVMERFAEILAEVGRGSILEVASTTGNGKKTDLDFMKAVVRLSDEGVTTDEIHEYLGPTKRTVTGWRQILAKLPPV